MPNSRTTFTVYVMIPLAFIVLSALWVTSQEVISFCQFQIHYGGSTTTVYEGSDNGCPQLFLCLQHFQHLILYCHGVLELSHQGLKLIDSCSGYVIGTDV